jgi:hypothetical protein
VRAFIFGAQHDEIDISRSHLSHCIGSYALTGRPRPVSMIRYLSEQQVLESDIERELLGVRAAHRAVLDRKIAAGGADPSRGQQTAIDIARVWYERTFSKAKHIFSALINAPNLPSWQTHFNDRDCPHLRQLIQDIPILYRAVLLHPKCVPFAEALAAKGESAGRQVSLCLGHLDECALGAVSDAFSALGCSSGPTINDSLILPCARPLGARTAGEVLNIAHTAAAQALSYPVRFSYLPNLTKPGDPVPTMGSILRTFGIDGAITPPPSPQPRTSPSDYTHSPTGSPGSSRQSPSPVSIPDIPQQPMAAPLPSLRSPTAVPATCQVEFARSKYSRCRGCDAMIHVGQLRYGQLQGDVTLWYHPHCWVLPPPPPQPPPLVSASRNLAVLSPVVRPTPRYVGPALKHRFQPNPRNPHPFHVSRQPLTGHLNCSLRPVRLLICPQPRRPAAVRPRLPRPPATPPPASRPDAADDCPVRPPPTVDPSPVPTPARSPVHSPAPRPRRFGNVRAERVSS